MTLFRLPALAGLALLAFVLPAQADPMDWAQGRWEADPAETGDPEGFTCGNDPLTIAIDRQGLRYQSSRSGQSYTAKIINIEEDVLFIQYDNEQRRNKDGEPVVWALKFPDPNHFYWVMQDWIEDGKFKRTAKRRRC